MHTVAIVSFCITVALLIIVTSVSPRRSRVSHYELDRRRTSGDKSASDELERELAIDDAVSLIRVVSTLLLVLCVLLAVVSFGWVIGCLISVIITLIYERLARNSRVHKFVGSLYHPYDTALMTFVQKRPWIGKLIRSTSTDITNYSVSSREELEHVIDQSGRFLTVDEKELLTSGLHFSEKTVGSVMTPRGVIAGVKRAELIGPVILDELHQTGHSRFPVFDGDIDHIIGVLHIRELLSLQDKKSQTADKAMEKKVFYIHQDQTLGEALAAFLKTRHHLFIVANGYSETAGLLTLEDIIEELLGHEIVDEFNVHDNLRIVAERKSKSNNHSPNNVDV